MTTQVIALASEFAALPGVRDAVRAVEEPSTLTVMLVGLAGLMIGRAMTAGRSTGAE